MKEASPESGTMTDLHVARLDSSDANAFIPSVLADLQNPAWGTAKLRVLIVRLSPLAHVEGSVSHTFLSAETRAAEAEAFIDFAFLPEKRDRAAFDKQGIPWFSGRISGQSPGKFDLILVSLAFTLELVNLAYLCTENALGFSARSRFENLDAPIVILGGSGTATAGSILSDKDKKLDCMVDAFFFGEGEGAVERIVRITASGVLRKDALTRISEVEGIWVPVLTDRPSGGLDSTKGFRRIVRPYPRPELRMPILNTNTASTVRLAITAGCPGFCSFCLEGWDRSPYREVPKEEILSAAIRLRSGTGADTLEIASYNFNTHKDIVPLATELSRIFRRVNFMSQRIDILARSPGLADLEIAADKRSFTLGIEGISSRMRAFYRKGLLDSDLSSAAERLLVPGVREIKLFFIISGMETDEDFADFGLLLETFTRRKRLVGSGARILVSAGYLVRMPLTPLQFAALVLDRAKLEKIADSLDRACRTAGIEFRLAAEYHDYYVDQVLSLAGPEFYDWVVGTQYKKFVYDDGITKACQDDLAEYARTRHTLDDAALNEKPEHWMPALGCIEGQNRHRILRKHYDEAKKYLDRPMCLGSACQDCGACPETGDRKLLGSHSRVPAGRAVSERLASLIAAKQAFPSIRMIFDFPQELAGSLPEYKLAWFSRLLEQKKPGAWKSVYRVKDMFSGTGGPDSLLPESPGYFGKTILELSGPDKDRLHSIIGLFGQSVPVSSGGELQELKIPSKRLLIEAGLGNCEVASLLAAIRAWLSSIHCKMTEYGQSGKAQKSPYSEKNESGPVRRFESAGRRGDNQQIQSLALHRNESGYTLELDLTPGLNIENLFKQLPHHTHKDWYIKVLDFS